MPQIFVSIFSVKFYRVVKMSDLHKDILTGLAFVSGVFALVAGEFIISSALFAATTYASNINLNRKKAAGLNLSGKFPAQLDN